MVAWRPAVLPLVSLPLVLAAALPARPAPAVAIPVVGPVVGRAADVPPALALSRTVTSVDLVCAPAPAPTPVVVAAPTAVATGRPVVVRACLPAGAGSVLLQRHAGGRWHTLARAGPADTGAVVLRSATSGLGSWVLRLVVIPGGDGRARVTTLRTVEVYRPVTYSVRGAGSSAGTLSGFAAGAAGTYADPRGWRRAHVRLTRVGTGGDFTLWLAAPERLSRFDPGCSAWYSCAPGRDVVVNEARWLHSAPHFTGSLDQYRAMVVNHETGHWLGLAHRSCRRRGGVAPVMQQQSKGMQGCRPNAWPLRSEVHAAARDAATTG